MGKSLSFLLVVSIAVVGFYGMTEPMNKPLFMNMEKEWQQVAKQQEIAEFYNPDSSLSHSLSLLTNEQDAPLLFYADILTPVCIDGSCKPVYIELYWNLVGQYVGYAIDKAQPLTKFDHDHFIAADYEKLHELLLDNNSILSRRKLEDLFDVNVKPAKKVTYKGIEVDAVTGATKKEIKETVIEGALYSCYTLWHLVYGEVNGKIKAYLQSIYSAELATAFLYSDYPDYQFYALKQMSPADYQPHLPQVVHIIEKSEPLIRNYILKKLPKDSWKAAGFSEGLYALFSTIDLNSRTLLLKNLSNASPIAATLLSQQMTVMTKNQLKMYLAYLEEDADRLTPTIRDNLAETVKSETYTFTYLISAFLE